mgnify:CR=1 FL=1
MINQEVDILIIGGGLTGAALMLALKDSGYKVLLVDKQPFNAKISPDFDARSLALSMTSQRILAMLNVWENMAEYACPIEHIHVSEQRRFGSARLKPDGQAPFGFVLEIQHLHAALNQHLNPAQLLAPAEVSALDCQSQTAMIDANGKTIAVKAGLIIAADGADSKIRQLCHLPKEEKKYQKLALVTNIGLAKPHRQRAFERFTEYGPLALLPMTGQRAAMVWSLPPKKAKAMQKVSDAQFLEQLQRMFGYRLGRFIKAGNRSLYPLRQVVMPVQSAWPVVFIGNAAHTLHPVAGQGFNLGLRDVALLAQYISQQGLSPAMVNHYEKARLFDQKVITGLTDGLVQLFSLSHLGWARGMGLFMFDNLPSMQKMLAQVASGFAGTTPDLACNIPITNPDSVEDSHETGF